MITFSTKGMVMQKLLFIMSVVGLSLAGCKSDPTNTPVGPVSPAPATGVYVLNEGAFGDPLGARLSLYDPANDSAYTDVYERANAGASLGSLGDDMAFYRGRAYIVMSGSEDLKVVSLENHRLLQSATFPGSTPHDIAIDSVRNRIYLTRLFRNSLLVVNLTTLVVTDTIQVGANPQGMVIDGNRMFVCNSGYGADRTVSVINLESKTVTATINLADGPTGATISSDGKLWVICSGNPFGTPATTGKVYGINTTSLAVTDSISFGTTLWGSVSAGNDVYIYLIGETPGSFYGGPIHRINVSSRSVVQNFIPGTFYGLAIDAAGQDIFAADARDFSATGEVSIFDKSGVFKKKFKAQRGPATILFKR